MGTIAGTIAKHSHKLAWRSLIDNPARIEVRNRQGPLPPCGQLQLGPLSVHNIFSATMVLILQFSLSRNLSGIGRNNRSAEGLQIAASGKVKVMTETYSLDEITKAYERVADGKVRFRAVYTKRTFQAAEGSYRMWISKISTDLSGRIGEILEL
jgi:hypothetical protein